jgi:hypothetical protein
MNTVVKARLLPAVSTAMRKLLLSGLLLSAVPAAYAHHSFAAEYFEDQSVVVEGDITEFRYRNPHAWVVVRAADESGAMATFSAEWAGAGRLGQMGVTADTLKPGDRVKITGAPGRQASERRIHLKAIERPVDGWTWSQRNRRR